MKTPRAEPGGEAGGLIDTSRMSAGKRDALELTESARAAAAVGGSFAGELFMGRAAWPLASPFPLQSEADAAAGADFLDELETVLRGVDADRIDAEGEIPDALVRRLAEMGAFGIKIPREHGGLGLSQTNYCRAAQLLGSVDANLTALLSAHQSIGVPQPLMHFGTEEQKARYLPRVARGEISAFALTEPGVGSDPARMATRAEPAPDGEHFVLNGEKLWCTNGTRAGVIVVMARTPDEMVGGRARRRITAFLVEMDAPGVEVVTRCRFMGLRALYNGVIRFTDVRLPRSAIVGGEGRGLKVALTTLNTGRLTIPAACAGLMKRCLGHARAWCATREQWGAQIGRHEAVADKLARMAARVFACESMVAYAAARADAGAGDIRIEAAMCKLWGSEAAWRCADDLLQLRGGRGYETAGSQRARGESAVPAERYLRDCRINTVFEGSSEIMRLFLAREALDPHLRVAGAALDSRLPPARRAAGAARAAWFYARWYPRLWWPSSAAPAGTGRDFAPALRYAARTSRRLARALFHAMARHGPGLEKRQLLLGRLVDVGAECFALATSALRADALLRRSPERHPRAELVELVGVIHAEARERIEAAFAALRRNPDREHRALARSLLGGRHGYLEDGIVRTPERDGFGD